MKEKVTIKVWREDYEAIKLASKLLNCSQMDVVKMFREKYASIKL